LSLFSIVFIVTLSLKCVCFDTIKYVGLDLNYEGTSGPICR